PESVIHSPVPPTACSSCFLVSSRTVWTSRRSGLRLVSLLRFMSAPPARAVRIVVVVVCSADDLVELLLGQLANGLHVEPERLTILLDWPLHGVGTYQEPIHRQLRDC